MLHGIHGLRGEAGLRKGLPSHGVQGCRRCRVALQPVREPRGGQRALPGLEGAQLLRGGRGRAGSEGPVWGSIAACRGTGGEGRTHPSTWRSCCSVAAPRAGGGRVSRRGARLRVYPHARLSTDLQVALQGHLRPKPLRHLRGGCPSQPRPARDVPGMHPQRGVMGSGRVRRRRLAPAGTY